MTMQYVATNSIVDEAQVINRVDYRIKNSFGKNGDKFFLWKGFHNYPGRVQFFGDLLLRRYLH